MYTVLCIVYYAFEQSVQMQVSEKIPLAIFIPFNRVEMSLPLAFFYRFV